VIDKKYCIDYETNVSFLDAEIDGNKIKCEETGYNLYNIYLWQQELINKLLKKHDKVILEIDYLEIGYVKELEFTKPFKLYEGRAVSPQCENCLKNAKCEIYQRMINEDFKISAQTNEQIYNLYLLMGAKESELKQQRDNLRKILDKKIEKDGGALQLENLGLQLEISETMKDSYPVEDAIENKLLTPKNCNIKITQFRKDIKNTEHWDKITKVPFQKKLQVINIPEIF